MSQWEQETPSTTPPDEVGTPEEDGGQEEGGGQEGGGESGDEPADAPA